MPHQVTVTGTLGPGIARSAMVVQNVNEVVFNLNPKILRVRVDDINGNWKDVDISAATTVTCTITSGNYAFVVS